MLAYDLMSQYIGRQLLTKLQLRINQAGQVRKTARTHIIALSTNLWHSYPWIWIQIVSEPDWKPLRIHDFHRHMQTRSTPYPLQILSSRGCQYHFLTVRNICSPRSHGCLPVCHAKGLLKLPGKTQIFLGPFSLLRAQPLSWNCCMAVEIEARGVIDSAFACTKMIFEASRRNYWLECSNLFLRSKPQIGGPERSCSMQLALCKHV